MNKVVSSERIKFIFHRNRRILFFDFSNLSDSAVALELIAQAKQLVAHQSPQSLFTLTDVSNSHYDKHVTAALQDLAKHNKPYVVAGAAIGVGGLTKVIYRSVLAFSGRKNIQLMDGFEEAVEWLAHYGN